jgi:DNA anti-recombination protein RmuC
MAEQELLGLLRSLAERVDDTYDEVRAVGERIAKLEANQYSYERRLDGLDEAHREVERRVRTVETLPSLHDRLNQLSLLLASIDARTRALEEVKFKMYGVAAAIAFVFSVILQTIDKVLP